MRPQTAVVRMPLLEARTNRIPALGSLLSFRPLPGNIYEEVIEAERSC